MFGWFKKKPPIGGGSRNDKVRAALREHGDDGTRIRHVIHFAYPIEDHPSESQEKVIATLAPYNVTFTQTEDSEGVVFEHSREVASGAFDGLTDELEELFSSFGWEYDGWECAVEIGGRS